MTMFLLFLMVIQEFIHFLNSFSFLKGKACFYHIYIVNYMFKYILIGFLL